MRVGILTVQVPFVRGGAEMHAENLCTAIRDAGHDAEIITVPFKWFPADRIAPQIFAARLLDVTESSGVPIDRVIGLKFPAYLTPHPNKVLWILHQHRTAYDLWETSFGDLHDQPAGSAARRAIREADTKYIAEAKAVFSNSRRVSDRLRTFNGIDSQPLYHPPPSAERYQPGPSEPFLIMPSRINAMKRQDLVLQALALTRHDVRIKVVGAADSSSYLERLRGLASAMPAGRVTFTGPVPEAEKLELFSRCRGVVYVPFDEDYGYVTLEAMLSSKPVITATDSGGTLEFVEHGRTGLVPGPDVRELAAAMDRLWESPKMATAWGIEGRRRYDMLGIGWSKVVSCLLA